MLLLFGKISRDPTTPVAVVYVDYLAVAPWNRKVVQHPQRFKNLGTVMLGAAVATSISTGLDGRCGLHSLPQSEGFYRRIGMSDLGIDPAYASLRYFEFSAQAAKDCRFPMSPEKWCGADGFSLEPVTTRLSSAAKPSLTFCSPATRAAPRSPCSRVVESVRNGI
jgi:hypothetical protein